MLDALAEEEQELEALFESIDKTCTRYKMESSAEKTKLMTNSASGIQREIKVKWHKHTSSTMEQLFQMMALSYFSSYKAEANFERQHHIFRTKGEDDALPCHFHTSVCLGTMDCYCKAREKNAGLCGKMLPKAIEHFVQRPCYQ